MRTQSQVAGLGLGLVLVLAGCTTSPPSSPAAAEKDSQSEGLSLAATAAGCSGLGEQPRPLADAAHEAEDRSDTEPDFDEGIRGGSTTQIGESDPAYLPDTAELNEASVIGVEVEATIVQPVSDPRLWGAWASYALREAIKAEAESDPTAVGEDLVALTVSFDYPQGIDEIVEEMAGSGAELVAIRHGWVGESGFLTGQISLDDMSLNSIMNHTIERWEGFSAPAGGDDAAGGDIATLQADLNARLEAARAGRLDVTGLVALVDVDEELPDFDLSDDSILSYSPASCPSGIAPSLLEVELLAAEEKAAHLDVDTPASGIFAPPQRPQQELEDVLNQVPEATENVCLYLSPEATTCP